MSTDKSAADVGLPDVNIENYQVVIDGRNYFDRPIDNYTVAFNNLRSVICDHLECATLLDYHYWINHYPV